jgi:hypothetical protein
MNKAEIVEYSDFIDLDWDRPKDRPALMAIFPQWITEGSQQIIDNDDE